MGDLLVWSLRAGRKQSGADGVYVEALAETCTESGSGQVKQMKCKDWDYFVNVVIGK